MNEETTSFGKAFDWLKEGTGNERFITRKNWYGSIANPSVYLQRPDDHSKMTEPYLYMEKIDMGKSEPDSKMVRFPLDLSCESLLADDWLCGINEENKQ